MLRFARSLILGLLLGSLAGLYFGWIQFPSASRNSAISDLTQRYRDDYTVMIAAGYAADRDATGALERLGKLAVNDIPIYLRQATERIISTSARGLNDIRLLVRLARDRINRTREAGLLVLLSVTGEKHELADGGAAGRDAYAAFLGEVAALGADAIEVWNEMNLDREWPSGQINPKHYAIMLQKAYTAIKTANPDTMVITGALLPTEAEGAFGRARVWNDDHYYFGMAKARVADYADCIGVQYNQGNLPPDAQAGDPRGNTPTRFLPLLLERVAFSFPRFRYPHVPD